MNGEVQSLTLNLIGPSTFLVFAVAFLWAWAIAKDRTYLLLIAGSCLLASAGGVFRLFVGWPTTVPLSILVSSLFYVATTLAGCEGILRRYGHRIGLAADLAILVGALSLVFYFTAVQPSFVVRVYLQNFIAGGIFLYTALRLVRLTRASLAERVVFWVLLVFALQFFPRTIATVAMLPDTGFEELGQSAFWQVLQLTNAVLGTALLLAVLIAELSEMIDRLQTERDVDRLTGVFNRRGFEDRAQTMLNERPDRAGALILFDVDHFKLVNDTYGHAAGDEVLRGLGALMRQTVRNTEILGRIGGEEFAILLPDGNREGAQMVVMRLQRALAAADFGLPEAAPRIAVSFGVAVRHEGEPYLTTFKRADAALYQAKAEGRKKAIFARE